MCEFTKHAEESMTKAEVNKTAMLCISGPMPGNNMTIDYHRKGSRVREKSREINFFISCPLTSLLQDACSRQRVKDHDE